MEINKVSIIIPVFNTEDFLPRCIESCLNQTYKDIEIIVIIDGSRDNSAAVARSFQQKDNRICVIEKKNEGLPITRRKGFEASKGEYIFHLDSDDYLESNAIELLVENLIKENSDIVIGGTAYEDKNGQYITSWISKISEESKVGYLKGIFNSSIQPNIYGRLIRREIFEPVHVPVKYNCGEDYLANIMMICYSPNLKITTEESLLYHYGVNSRSLTNTWPAEEFMPYTDEIEKILKDCRIESEVMDEWAWFRVIKAWRYYLRRGGKKYLKDKTFILNFYKKYYTIVKTRLTFFERFELNLYKHDQFLAFNFSRMLIYLRQSINKMYGRDK